VGSPQLSNERSNCQGYLLRDGSEHGFVTRVHQEDTENSVTGYRFGPETYERTVTMKKENIGSSFDDFLREDGIYEEVTATAIKRVLARQIAEQMEQQQITKAAMAKRMHTSRAALDRLLDPENDAITLNTLFRAATAVGRQIHFELV
jgi:predicted XRE-type DNA-binding protein